VKELMAKFTIIKKDGSEDEFDKKKIYKSCRKAGASEDIAKKISNEIEKELTKIPSTKIRQMVLNKLKKMDQNAADKMVKYDIEHKHA
jgi:transcriptional regulator NrdR family protein